MLDMIFRGLDIHRDGLSRARALPPRGESDERECNRGNDRNASNASKVTSRGEVELASTVHVLSRGEARSHEPRRSLPSVERSNIGRAVLLYNGVKDDRSHGINSTRHESQGDERNAMFVPKNHRGAIPMERQKDAGCCPEAPDKQEGRDCVQGISVLHFHTTQEQEVQRRPNIRCRHCHCHVAENDVTFRQNGSQSWQLLIDPVYRNP
mmetsp:Transcript_15582/g.33839  ORF Transcript_15582/g.33839 Transcript_15582/m.33839 type:complete len:209 (-) Transcript_15582:90-716(-)